MTEDPNPVPDAESSERPGEVVERQGVVTDAVIAGAAGGAAGAVAKTVAEKVIDAVTERPPPEPEPEIILPPGVDRPE